jgi:hypothetical protein
VESIESDGAKVGPDGLAKPRATLARLSAGAAFLGEAKSVALLLRCARLGRALFDRHILAQRGSASGATVAALALSLPGTRAEGFDDCT